MSKKAATAALLGDPIDDDSVAAAPAAKKKKIKKEDGTAAGVATNVPMDKQLVKLLAAAPKGMSQDEVCSALNVQPTDILEHINELLNRVSTNKIAEQNRANALNRDSESHGNGHCVAQQRCGRPHYPGSPFSRF